MRLDLFLKKCRIIKRRTVAAQMAKSGRIKKDSRELKPGYDVKVDDEIEILFGNRVMRIKVTDTTQYPQYEIINEISI